MKDDDLIHLLLGVCIFLVGALEGVIVWNWRRMVHEIENKVDKDEIEQLRADLQSRWSTQDQLAQSRDERQDRQHRENRSRMDEIYQLLAGRPPRRN